MIDYHESKTPLREEHVDVFIKRFLTDQRILHLMLITMWQYPDLFSNFEHHRLKREIINYLYEKEIGSHQTSSDWIEDKRYFAYNVLANMEADKRKKNPLKTLEIQMTRRFLEYRRFFWNSPDLNDEDPDDLIYLNRWDK